MRGIINYPPAKPIRLIQTSAARPYPARAGGGTKRRSPCVRTRNTRAVYSALFFAIAS
jgi:hypothetical protein